MPRSEGIVGGQSGHWRGEVVLGLQGPGPYSYAYTHPDIDPCHFNITSPTSTCVMAEQEPPPLNAIALAMLPNYLSIVEIAYYYLFIGAIGEIASAYVTIAASNRVKHMCNGNLHK